MNYWPGLWLLDRLLANDHAGVKIERARHFSDSADYDAVDRRLMDTFPASDSVARY